MNVQVLLGPAVNIQRVPLAGRNFETYRKTLTSLAVIGIGFVKGVQSEARRRFGQTLCRQTSRKPIAIRGSSNIDERTLRDDLSSGRFEMIVDEGDHGPLWPLTSAQRDIHVRKPSLVKAMCEGRVGFDGLVMSDWLHCRQPVAARALRARLEMPGRRVFRFLARPRGAKFSGRRKAC